MAIEVPVSRLLIMCTQPPGSERPDPEVLRHVLEIGRQTQPLAKEGIETSIVTGETRDFAEDFLFQKVRKPFSLVYLSGTMPEKGSLVFPARGGGLTRIDETDLGRTLAAIPEVQMVFLSGMASPELVRTLLLAGVPAVLSIGQEEGAALFADEYFFQLIQGKTLRQAFFDAQEGLGFRIPLHEANYDPEREILTWSDNHEPDLGFGLTVRVHKIRALSWRLRNPLAITPAERESWKTRSYPNHTQNEQSQKGSRLRNRIRKEDADPELYTSQTRTPATDETRTVRQRPTRSNQTEVREEEAAAAPRRKYGRIALAVLAVALAVTGLSFVPQVRNVFGNLFKRQEPEALCPFPQSDGKYHVLVLPFNSKPGCTENYPQFRNDLTDRISRMEKTEGLAVSVRTVNLIDCAEGGESLREMAVSCQADLVIWGLIQKDTFSGKETLELRYVAMSDAGEQSFLSGAGLNLRSPLDQPGTLSAQISTQTTQLLRWTLGYGRMNEGKYEEAIRLFEGISTEKREIDNLVSSMIARCYVRAGQFSQARAVYDTKVSAYPNDPNVYIDRAQILIETGDTLSALVDFDFALNLDPANISAIIGRGNLYSSLGKFEEALTDFDRVIAMNPDFAPVYCRRAELFISTGKTSAALSDLDHAINLQPGYADAWYLRGKLRYENKQEAAGIADIDRALQITPEHPEAVKMRANIHLARQEWSQAAEVYTRLLARRRSPEVFHQRGLLYLKINRTAEAIADFTRAIELKANMESAWYARAEAYLQQHSYDLALADYRQLCKDFPDRAENWRMQGEVLMQMERFGEAETALNQAIALDGNHAVAWSMRGLARFRQGKTDEAFGDISKALEIRPDQAEVWYYRGLLQVARGDNKAQESFDKAIQLQPIYPAAYYQRALLAIGSGRPQAAAADLDKAIAQGLNEGDAYLRRARLLEDEGKTDAALKALEEAIVRMPGQASAYFQRASIYERRNQLMEAMADYQKALEIQPDAAPSVYLRRGMLYYRMNRPAEALSDLNRGMTAYPDSARLFVYRGLVSLSAGNISRASDDFANALRRDPRLPEGYFGRGELYRREKKYSEALASYDEALKLMPQYPDAHNGKGEVFVLLEAGDRAMNEFNKALEINPRFAGAYNNRGKMYRKNGDYPRALADFGKAIQLDPLMFDAYYNRGFIYSLQNKPDLALADIQKSLEINPSDGVRQGFLAKLYAKQGQDGLVFHHLELALENGYPVMELSKDPAFRSYQDNSRFQALLAEHQK